MSSTTMLSRFSSRSALALLVVLIFALAVPTESYRRGWTNALVNRQSLCKSEPHIIAELLRGGTSDDESSDDEEEAEEQEDEEEEYDAESEAEEEEEEEDEYDVEEEEISASIQKKSEDYVDPYFMSPTMSIYTTIGSIMIARKLDMYNPTVVRVLRFAFIAQIILQQLFILYFRIMASKNNDRTPLTIQNQMSSMLQSQLDQAPGGANDMVKNLASSFLSSSSTVMEYDIKQANNMQGGMLFTLALMWFLHFKLGQVQPLLMQIATGIMNLGFSPLFQVYVLGRNLERPFKTPVSAAQKMADAAAATASEQTEEVIVASEEKAEEDEEQEEENDEDEQEEDSEDNDEDTEENDAEAEEGDAEGDEEAVEGDAEGGEEAKEDADE